MKKYLIAALTAIVIVSAEGCSGTEASGTSEEELTAARIEGRRAARDIVTSPANDSVELQRRLLDAKAIQSRYLIEKRQDCAAAFDSAFISTIRAVRPDIAEKLK